MGTARATLDFVLFYKKGTCPCTQSTAFKQTGVFDVETCLKLHHWTTSFVFLRANALRHGRRVVGTGRGPLGHLSPRRPLANPKYSPSLNR